MYAAAAASTVTCGARVRPAVAVVGMASTKSPGPEHPEGRSANSGRAPRRLKILGSFNPAAAATAADAAADAAHSLAASAEATRPCSSKAAAAASAAAAARCARERERLAANAANAVSSLDVVAASLPLKLSSPLLLSLR